MTFVQDHGLADAQEGVRSPVRVYLANVGVNASHRFWSPLFADGTFEFVPIPERQGPAASPMRRYRDLWCFNDPSRPLTDVLPRAVWDTFTHADPEFETFTYGDNCGRTPRAAALMGIQPGDLLFFLARLTPWQHGRVSGPSGFYLIGFLDIEQVVSSVWEQPAPHVLAAIGNNAHVRRALADPTAWDGFWVFCGSTRSVRFPYAVPFTRTFAEQTMRDARGQPWQWEGRSELQTIGSYTRSCRCVLSPETDPDGSRTSAWWTHIRQFNPQVSALADAYVPWSSPRVATAG